MSEIPFWKQSASGDDTASQAPTNAIPTVPGGVSAIDPETGAWRPVKRGDPFTIGRHEFRWSEGPIARATLHDSDGNKLGAMNIPFDPETEQPSDDMLAEATRLYSDMEHMRSIVKDDAVDALVSDIHKSGTAETMVSIVAELLEGGLKVTVTDDDGSDGLTPEQLETLSAEAGRIFDAELPQIVRSVTESEIDDGHTFWQQFARDIIATATLHARDAVIDDLGGPEVVENMSDDEFEPQVLEAYRTGPFITGAMLMLTRQWTQMLGEMVSESMAQFAQGEESENFSEKLLKAARKSLGMEETPAAHTPPTLTPAFDADGYGRTNNSVIAIGARRAFSAAPARWNIDVEGFPVFTHENGSGKALYAPSRTHFPTARDAMRAVEGYGPAHVAMLRYITAKHIANSEARTTGPYGGFYLSVEEFLNFRGIKKQTAGGYRTEDRREVIELIEALECIEVTGSIEGYEKALGKRGRKSKLTIRSPLIIVSQRITQPSITPGSPERPVAWYLRPGDWAAELNRFGPQFAVTTKALLQLNTQNDMHAFSIGNHLTEQYRIRASQRSWQQPYRVLSLLEDAEIELDRKNPGRFRKRIEAALDVLKNPIEMQSTPIIESWKYVNVVEPKGRGWLDRWLDSGIIITPPAGLISPYESIGRHRRKPKKLAG